MKSDFVMNTPEQPISPDSPVLPKGAESLPIPEIVSTPEAQSLAEQSVNATKVHGRGGIIPEKGDVFVNPTTGTQQIVERVRKDGQDQVVMFTKEIEPGVRQEPGKLIRQLPVENFEVQRDTGEYTEFHSQEYDNIFNACSEAFEAMNSAYKSLGDNIPSEAQQKMDRVGELAREVGEIDDIWEALGNRADPAIIRQKRKLIDRLKSVVAKLPEELLKPFPLLEKIRIERKIVKKSDDTILSKEEIEDKNKQAGKRPSRGKRIHENDGKERQGNRGRSKAANHNSVATHARDHQQQAIQAQPVMPEGERSTPQRRAVFESLSPEELQGIVDDQFVKYGMSRAEWSADWKDDEQHSLAEWVQAIRTAQNDLTDLAQEIRQARRIGRWGEAMDSLDPQYRDFATEANGIEVTKRLGTIETEVKSLGEGNPERIAYEKATRQALQPILLKYLDILRAGVSVLAQAKHRSSEPKQEQFRDRRTDRNVRLGRERSFVRTQSEASHRAREVRDGDRNAESFEGQEAGMLEDMMREISDQQNAIRILANKLAKRGLLGHWIAALKRKGKVYEPFARSDKVKMVNGELEDIQQTFSRWAGSEDERQKWLDATLARLGQYGERYRVILETGEEVVDESRRKQGKNKSSEAGFDDKGVIVEHTPTVLSTELALIEGGIIPRDFPKPVREALLKGMESVGGVAKEELAKLVAAIAQAKPELSPEIHAAAARYGLQPVVLRSLQRLFASANIQLTEQNMGKVAESIAVNPDVQRIEYGGK